MLNNCITFQESQVPDGRSKCFIDIVVSLCFFHWVDIHPKIVTFRSDAR